jgi:hypothetical protein
MPLSLNQSQVYPLLIKYLGLGGSMMHEVNRVPNSCLSPTDTSLNPQDTSISPIDTSLSPQDNRLNPPDTSHSPSFETNLNPSVSGTLTCITSPQQSVINKVSFYLSSSLFFYFFPLCINLSLQIVPMYHYLYTPTYLFLSLFIYVLLSSAVLQSILQFCEPF